MCRRVEFQDEMEATYCIEEGNASYSSADIILSPARLKAPVSPLCSLLRRRLLVMLRRSVVLGLVVELLVPCFVEP